MRWLRRSPVSQRRPGGGARGGWIMRVIALEEHFTAPHLAGRIDPEVVRRRGFRPRRVASGAINPMELAAEIGERRLRLMDEAGITMQVLSNTGPGPDLVPGAEGVAMAAAMNDHLAEAVARAPDRFAGFAVLPMRSPEDCAAELTRAVRALGFRGALINGTTEGRFLDHPAYDGLLAEAEALDVPIYIHPHLASEAEADHRPHGRDAADDDGARRRGLRQRRRASATPRQPGDPGPGLDHHQRHLHRAALPGRAADPRHRPHRVLGRLSLRGEHEGKGLPGPHRPVPSGYGEACLAERNGAAGARGVIDRRTGWTVSLASPTSCVAGRRCA